MAQRIRAKRLGAEVYEDFPHDVERTKAAQERGVMERGLAVDPWLDLTLAIIDRARRDAKGDFKPVKPHSYKKQEETRLSGQDFLRWAQETIQ